MINQTLVRLLYKTLQSMATIIQDSTNHVATLPTGHNGYIEVPITNEKPKFYQVNDISTIIHNVTHTYHTEMTEQKSHKQIMHYNLMIILYLLIIFPYINSI